jgi:hypothetical protein
MALFGDVHKEALPAKRIAANLSRLLPDFSPDHPPPGERSFIDRQENHMRRAVEAADIVTIAIACNGGRIAGKYLPFLLSNPIIAKASTLFLTTKMPVGVEPIDADGNLHRHFADLIHELTSFYGQRPVDLENSLKQEFIEWRDVAALILAGESEHLLSEEDVPNALSDGEILPYLIKALQLLKILRGGAT